MPKFYEYLNETLIEKKAKLEEMERAEGINEDDLGRRAVLELLYIVEHGLPDVYDSFDAFLYDFWPNPTWNQDGQRKDVRTILEDPRFNEIIQPGILRDWNFDMRRELEAAFKDEE